jgi:hypothetical protein
MLKLSSFYVLLFPPKNNGILRVSRESILDTGQTKMIRTSRQSSRIIHGLEDGLYIRVTQHSPTTHDSPQHLRWLSCKMIDNGAGGSRKVTSILFQRS